MLSEELLTKVLKAMEPGWDKALFDYDALIVLTAVQPQFNDGRRLRRMMEERFGGSLPLGECASWLADLHSPERRDNKTLEGRLLDHKEALVSFNCTMLLEQIPQEQRMIWPFFLCALSKHALHTMKYFSEREYASPWGKTHNDVQWVLPESVSQNTVLLTLTFTLRNSAGTAHQILRMVLAWVMRHASITVMRVAGSQISKLPEATIRQLCRQCEVGSDTEEMRFLAMLLVLYRPEKCTAVFNNTDLCPFLHCPEIMNRIVRSAACDETPRNSPLYAAIKRSARYGLFVCFAFRHWKKYGDIGFRQPFEKVCCRILSRFRKHHMLSVPRASLLHRLCDRYNLTTSGMMEVVMLAKGWYATSEQERLKYPLTEELFAVCEREHALLEPKTM